MTYLDFTLEILDRDFGIKARDQAIFPAVGELAPSARLEDCLRVAEDVAIVSEKSRSEFIVAPILIDCREHVQRRVNIFSGIRLDIDAEHGLKGETDFILARSASRYALQTPIMVILEAKRHDIEQGIGQCSAQMLGACRFNERSGSQVPYLYGCVTDSDRWQFLKLHGQALQIHPERFTIKEVRKILWFLVQCLNDVDQQASHAA